MKEIIVQVFDSNELSALQFSVITLSE